MAVRVYVASRVHRLFPRCTRDICLPSHVRLGAEWSNACAHDAVRHGKNSARSKTGIISIARRVRRRNTRFQVTGFCESATLGTHRRASAVLARVHLSRLSNPGRISFPEFISFHFSFLAYRLGIYLIRL